jgi:coenzyme F420 hydrogenase subunit beta
VVKINGEEPGERSMSYEESWGTILCKHTQFRCRLCPDSTGQLADISCGDPWYRQIEPDDPGRSLVLVRTDVGRRILHDALQAGYVQLQPAAPDTLPRSQRSLLLRRRHLWGRLLALRMFGVPVPQYRGFPLLANWRSLSLADKLRSVLGTARRTWTRHWNKPLGD